MSCDSFGQWLENAARYPVLTDEEVIVHSRHVRAWKDHDQKPRLGQRSAEILVRHNLRLVPTVWSKQFGWVGKEDHRSVDMLQEGVIGLTRGVHKFDPTRGHRFSTYAWSWIRQGMGEYLRNRGRMIRVAASCSESALKAQKYSTSFHAEHGRYPTIEELAAVCKVPAKTMAFYLERWQTTNTRTLNAPGLGMDQDGCEILDLLVAPEAASTDSIKRREDQAKAITDLLGYADLTIAEQVVLKHRYLEDRLSLKQIGRMPEVAMSQEGVRGVERRMMRRLQRLALHGHLDPFVSELYDC